MPKKLLKDPYEMFVMDLSATLGKTWRETTELLDSDEEELVQQLAYRKLKPFPDPWYWWATIFESQMSGKKFNYERWMPVEKEQKAKPTWQQIKAKMSILR